MKIINDWGYKKCRKCGRLTTSKKSVFCSKCRTGKNKPCKNCGTIGHICYLPKPKGRKIVKL